MVMPEDPVMLLSFVNMKLRDFYGSLDALCEECGVDKAGLVEKLKKIDYVYDEVALEQKLNEKINERKAAGVKIYENAEKFKQAGYTAQQRFKGLGEMDAAQLWETTMNPENRTLVKVNIEDAERADAIFTKLMGDSVELRKNFIQTNAAKVNVEDLDF